LQASDPIKERKHRPVSINLQQDKTYVIDLTAVGLDPYLLLFDPFGTKVAWDDDSGGGLNARIRYRAKTTGNHTIGVSCLGLHQGTFTLTVREEP
jgi:hypothetical protein